MGESRPTISDIARAAGVSVATVSRALRNLPNVASATRTRVVEVAAEFQYELHPQASRLASGRTWTVGVAAPLFGTWFPSRALGGINSVLATAGYDLLISMMTTPEDRRRFLREARYFCRRVDGIVLIDTFVSAEGSSADSFFDRPVVAVGERLAGAGSIAIDNRLAARRLLSKWCGSWRWGGVGAAGWPVGRWGRWGWGARRGAGVSEGEGAVVVGDAEVGEAHEVDGGGSGGEPEVVGGDAPVGDASGFVAGEPRDGAFGHGAVLLVGALGGGLGPAGLVG